MTREELYNYIKEILNGEPAEIIAGSFAVMSEYDDRQYNIDRNRMPLANNGTRDEIYDNYTEDQIKEMAHVINEHKRNSISLPDKVLNRELKKSINMTLRQRMARIDNGELILKKDMLDKEKIITNLLYHQDILYNPLVIYNTDINQCRSILKFDLGFIDKHEFLSKKYVGNSRNYSATLVDIEKLKAIGYPKVERKDILDVDLRNYTLTIWLYIQKNNFNILNKRDEKTLIHRD